VLSSRHDCGNKKWGHAELDCTLADTFELKASLQDNWCKILQKLICEL
jgi:hypothetical protein